MQEECLIQGQVWMKKSAHQGHSPKTAAEDFKGLKLHFEQLQCQDRDCTTRMLSSVELKRQPAGNGNVHLKKRIKCWLSQRTFSLGM